MKNELIKSQEKIYRILDRSEQEILVIDCQKLTMPQWVEASTLVADVDDVTLETLCEITGTKLLDVERISPEDKYIAHRRFTMISDIIPCVADRLQRAQKVAEAAERYGVTKQTVRKYLCLYLSYQTIGVLAPKRDSSNRSLTQDEKYMRWGLNKFFYNTKKNSLAEAYTMMIKAKYTDENGKLLSEYPSIHQFRYFYRKTRKMQNFYISRDGIKDYQRNNRPLTGDGVQEFANHVGVGMLDGTVCDIYLVNEAGQLVGRPLLTAAVDAFSGMCMGYTLTWEGGVYSLKELTASMLCDKSEHCRKHGIIIGKDEWDCSCLPGTIVTDKGSEYVSENFAQMTELGITLIDLPSFRPELKGVIEKFFDLIQSSFKPYLKGRGVIESDFAERGAHDYRKDACLTMEDFEKVLIQCILYYNNSRVIDNYPYTDEMIRAHVKPYSRDIFTYGSQLLSADLISIDYSTVMQTLLPRTTGGFTRYGLKVNKLRYHCDGYTEQYLTGGDVTVAYNPDDVSAVWILEKGCYIRFDLIESRFEGKSLTEVEDMKEQQRQLIKGEAEKNLQAKIDLATHIQTIAEQKSVSGLAEIKGASKTRQKKKKKKHRNVMKEVTNG